MLNKFLLKKYLLLRQEKRGDACPPAGRGYVSKENKE
jgi:hypothetical protein